MAESNSRRLGFLGTGNLVSAVVEGFCTSAQPPAILVSPRNEAKSRNLAERWPNVRRAGSNQDVVDGSDIVFIGLRLAVALEVLPQLRFRPDQTVVSLIPVLPYARTLALVQPASRVFRALCLPYVAKHFGQIPHFPAGDGAAEVLAGLCEPLPMRSERELHRLWAITCLISTYYALLQATHAWCVDGGARPEVAHSYTVSMFDSLTRMAEGGAPFDHLAAEAATTGGLNQWALRNMQAGTMFPDYRATLDAILERFGPDPA